MIRPDGEGDAGSVRPVAEEHVFVLRAVDPGPRRLLELFTDTDQPANRPRIRAEDGEVDVQVHVQRGFELGPSTAWQRQPSYAPVTSDGFGNGFYAAHEQDRAERAALPDSRPDGEAVCFPPVDLDCTTDVSGEQLDPIPDSLHKSHFGE